MGKLFDQIRAAVAGDRYVVGNHADERLRERGIVAWQVIDGFHMGRLLSERADDLPNPSVEVDQFLADGTPVKVVWSLIVAADTAKLVTVHFYDR
jgi:hypothetical protein